MAGRIQVSAFRKQVSDLLDIMEAPGNWMIVTRRGRDAAAVISLDLFRHMLDERPRCDDLGCGTRSAERGRQRPILTKSGLETAAMTLHEVKSGEPQQPAPAPSKADDLLHKIDETRREFGLSPFDGQT